MFIDAALGEIVKKKVTNWQLGGGGGGGGGGRGGVGKEKG